MQHGTTACPAALPAWPPRCAGRCASPPHLRRAPCERLRSRCAQRLGLGAAAPRVLCPPRASARRGFCVRPGLVHASGFVSAPGLCPPRFCVRPGLCVRLGLCARRGPDRPSKAAAAQNAGAGSGGGSAAGDAGGDGGRLLAEWRGDVGILSEVAWSSVAAQQREARRPPRRPPASAARSCAQGAALRFAAPRVGSLRHGMGCGARSCGRPAVNPKP